MENIKIIFNGFSGKMENFALGWGTAALIKENGKNILIDTGSIGLRAYFKDMLNDHDLEFQDIDYVLLTHLHFDHSGNVELFPNARFFLSEKEWEYANEYLYKDPYINTSDILYLKKSNLELIKEEEIEILPNFKSVISPGHTPGSTSYIYSKEGTTYGFVGDAIKNRGEFINEEVQISLNFEETKKSIRKLKKLCDWILPGHDNWLKLSNSELIYQSNNYKKIVFGEGLTVNSGQNSILLFMDEI